MAVLNILVQINEGVPDDVVRVDGVMVPDLYPEFLSITLTLYYYEMEVFCWVFGFT